MQQEKITNLESKNSELIRSYEAEVARLRQDNEQLNAALYGDKAQIQAEVEKWKKEFAEMERQHTDVSNNYDRDKALWENKFKFLEQQREQLKRDSDDNSKKFS